MNPPAQAFPIGIETPDAVAVGWIDPQPIEFPSGASLSLVITLSDLIECPAVIGLWSVGVPTEIETPTDVRYANAFLMKNSANSDPGQSIDPDVVRSNGDWRLFNRLKVRITEVRDGRIRAFVANGVSRALVGRTPIPCLVGSAAPQVHFQNGARAINSTGRIVFQMSQGRVGMTGQEVDRTLNYPDLRLGSGTPWIWSILRFDKTGSLLALDSQIFPTYSIFLDGQLVQTIRQGDLDFFVIHDETSQRRVDQIQ